MENLFYYNVQAANLLEISEWTIRKYNKSGAVFKNSFFKKKTNRWSILALHGEGNFKIQDKKKSPGSSIGRAKLWRCLGYKFKSYLGQLG